MESGKLSLSSVKYFILDEADRLLDTGNQDLILNLFSRFPKAGTGAARLQVTGRDEEISYLKGAVRQDSAGLQVVKRVSLQKMKRAANDLQQLLHAVLCCGPYQLSYPQGTNASHPTQAWTPTLPCRS